MRRELAVCLAVGLLGGGLVLLGADRPWDSAQPVAPSVTGDEVNPVGSLASSLGAVLLLGTIVVAVTRTVGRRLAGAVVALGAIATAGVAVTAEGSWSVWRVAVLAGAVLGLLAGALAVTRGQRWSMMSQRYDAPTAPEREPAGDPWRALDRGDDPTL